MSKLFQENGFLNKDGERAVFLLKNKLEDILDHDDVRNMSVQELYVLQSNLMKLVADAMSNKIANRQKITNEYAHMTDDEFYAYLKDKYGDLWQFMSLTPEEISRIPLIFEEEIMEAIKQGCKDWEAVRSHQGGYIPRGFYRGEL